MSIDEPVPMRMPDLLQPRRLGRHVLDSALAELRLRGLPDECVRIHPVSSGGGLGVVVGQDPKAGAPIDERAGVHLYVELPSLMDRLPYALRDENPEEFGVDQILGLFDSPAAHVGHYLRRGGELYALREGDDQRAQRWLEEVFAIDAALFDRARWYRLSRLAAELHILAGRVDAPVTALRVMYGMPSKVRNLVSRPGRTLSNPAAALGSTRSHLGFSTILGGEPRSHSALSLDIGPVSLKQFELHRSGALRRERVELYRLTLPFWIDADVAEYWHVAGPAAGARLGADPGTSPRLGWTSYMATAPDVPMTEFARG